jgi:hypothetical protein
MPTDDQIRQPCRAPKLQLPIKTVRLSSRHYPVHLAAYPEVVVPTQWKTQYTSRVARYVLRPTNTKDIPRTRIICQSQPTATSQ